MGKLWPLRTVAPPSSSSTPMLRQQRWPWTMATFPAPGTGASRRFEETTEQSGCVQLKSSFEKLGLSVDAGEVLDERAAHRNIAFCGGCCKKSSWSGRWKATWSTTFPFEGKTWRCHNMYNEHVWYKPGMYAQDSVCMEHCNPPAEVPNSA